MGGGIIGGGGIMLGGIMGMEVVVRGWWCCLCVTYGVLCLKDYSLCLVGVVCVVVG